jgi:hypothetical protein
LNSFALSTPHRAGVKIQTDHVFRGTVGATITATIFVNAASPSLSGSYIFYARNGNPGDKDPLTILKALPPTDANRRAVADSIIRPANSILCGGSISPEDATGLADVIVTGEVVKSVQPPLFSLSVFKVVRGLVAKGHIWVRDQASAEQQEMVANEGGSYIFFLGKTNPYNTNDFNVFKVMPASPENIAQAEKLAARIPGPKPVPLDSSDGGVGIHMDPGVNNDDPAP